MKNVDEVTITKGKAATKDSYLPFELMWKMKLLDKRVMTVEIQAGIFRVILLEMLSPTPPQFSPKQGLTLVDVGSDPRVGTHCACFQKEKIDDWISPTGL